MSNWRATWGPAGPPLIICVLAWVALGVGPVEWTAPSEWTDPTAVATREQAPTPGPQTQPEQPRHYTPAAREALRGLGTGEQIAGWRVTSVDGERDDGSIHVGFERAAVAFEAIVVPRGSWPHQPPKRTSKYDFFYTGVDAKQPNAPIVGVLEQLATRVDP
ncbi:MAG: hypothetical protein ACPG4T_03875 [Nannocystaceae bacterium]